MANILNKITNSLKIVKDNAEKQAKITKKSSGVQKTANTQKNANIPKTVSSSSSGTGINVVIDPAPRPTQDNSSVIIVTTTSSDNVDPKINIDELVAAKRQYTMLKDDVDNMINKLNNCIKYLETPASTIASVYTIDNVAIDKGNLKTIRQNLINKKNFLSNEVLAEINLKIKEISEVIS